jgi:hypothetical protein
MVFCANKTNVATSKGSGGSSASVTRINRLQSASFGEDTNVDEVTEMGAQFRVGGVDELGEAKVKLDWNAVGIGNLAALTGTTVNTAAGSTTTIGLTQLQSAQVDLFRLVADVTNTVFKTTYAQDAVIVDWTVDVKDKGMPMEGLSFQGPVVEDFPGFVIPTVHLSTAGDASGGYLNVSDAIGTNELPMAVYQPGPTEAPSYWSENGANYFLKIEKVPGANLANSPIRYYEYVNATFQSAAAVSSTAYITPSAFIKELMTVGTKVQLEVPGSANAEVVTITAVASQVNTNSGSSSAVAGSATITPASMLGIFPGVTLTCVNSDGSQSENLQVTSTTSTTFTATFTKTKTAGFLITSAAPSFQANVTKTHSIGAAIYPYLAQASNGVGYATYFPTGTKLYIGDTITAGDAFRLTFHSYNTDSFPTTIPTNSPDTAERPGVSYRVVPMNINGGTERGFNSASFKYSLKRDHVNGLGDKAIVYGVPSVPDVAISLDAKERTASLLARLLTGSPNLTGSPTPGTTLSDNQEFSYLTRRGLKTAIPVSVVVNDPYNAGAVLCTYSCPQFVVKNISLDSSAKADNTWKISGIDITGNMTVSYTAPQ